MDSLKRNVRITGVWFISRCPSLYYPDTLNSPILPRRAIGVVTHGRAGSAPEAYFLTGGAHRRRGKE